MRSITTSMDANRKKNLGGRVTDRAVKLKGTRSMENKPRKPLIAGLLSIIQPGLGQVYNGEIRKAVIFYLLPILLLPAAIILCLNGKFIPFILILSALLIPFFYAVVFIDAFRTAKRYSNQYSPKKYNKIIAYIGICLLVSILSNSLFTVVKNNIVQTFKLPSGSMEPTLLKGDHIIVDRGKSAKTPNKGDLIIFEYPKDPSKDFIKRVVAVGGETVEFKNKILFVNGKAMTEPYVIHQEADTIPASQNPRDNFGPHVVASGSYFVIGDNRDKSYDSRFFGDIMKDKIKGTVKSIYWSWNKEKFAVRWDRVGMKVQ